MYSVCIADYGGTTPASYDYVCSASVSRMYRGLRRYDEASVALLRAAARPRKRNHFPDREASCEQVVDRIRLRNDESVSAHLLELRDPLHHSTPTGRRRGVHDEGHLRPGPEGRVQASRGRPNFTRGRDNTRDVASCAGSGGRDLTASCYVSAQDTTRARSPTGRG